jgi:hypothetical protein
MKPQLRSLIHIEAPSDAELDSVFASRYLLPFNAEVVDFVAALSARLMADSEVKNMPELVALAFWMRKKNILELKQDFYRRAEHHQLPRGLVFHIVPSNVDTIFIYSLFLSMFCGNSNIVRLSSRLNAQVDVLVKVLDECLADFPLLAARTLLVRYEHNDDITAFYSRRCDVRMIWGGDETIDRIRRFPLAPAAKELTFADRFSLALLDAQAYLQHADKDRLVAAFYNDSYWFNQMACSSPRLVCWVGEDAEQLAAAKADFWSRLQRHIEQKSPDIAPAALMDKYLTQCRYVIETDGASIAPSSSQYLSRVQLHHIDELDRELHCGNGLFLEIDLATLEQLADVVQRKDQTVAAFGFSSQALADFIEGCVPVGIDRIVPFGEALAFASVWDGYDLLFELTRCVTIKT